MKISLVRPSMITTGVEFVSRQVPLNLCYLAAVLLDEGAEVQIWDFDVERYSDRGFSKRLQDFKPDIVGFSLMTPTAPRGARMAKVVKRVLPNALTVAGGPHPSAMPERTLEEFPDFDIAVFGEGERTLVDLVTRASSIDFEDVSGIAYRNGSGILRNKARPVIDNLDSLPFPARHLLALRRYKGQSYRGFSRDFLNIAEVSTSRGCPNACIFCAIQATHGTRVRFRSAKNVIAELRELVRGYRTNHIVFLDDTFTLKPGRLHEIMNALRQLKLTWNCTTRVDSVDEDLLREMVAHGCRGVAFGVESGSPKILELVGKGIDTGMVKRAFRAAHRAGVANIEADFVLGVHPSETEEDMRQTERLIREIRPTTLFVSTAVPYPGTPLWDLMQNDGLIVDEPQWEEFLMYGGGDSWRTKHFSMDELRRRQNRILRKFYIAPRYILSRLMNTRSMSELFYYLKSGLSLLRSGAR